MSASLQQVLDAVDDRRLLSLLTDAVAQYSPSYAEEPVMEVFCGRLAECGISYLRQPVPQLGGTISDERANLIVELGPHPAHMMWVGHVDTVPMIDDEYPGVQQEGDILHGLGTADMKSGCAAITEAIAALVACDVEFKRGLCVALVVGEEEYGDGSQALLAQRTAPLVVIGEPTGLVPCVSHYGYYECRLRTFGTRAHAALPEVGASAIHAMLEWMGAILDAAYAAPFAEKMSVNPREIRGGGELFVVADECEAAIDFHVPPGVSADTVSALVATARAQAAQTHPTCRLEFENVFWAPGYANAPDEPGLAPLGKAYEHLDLAWSPTPFRSHSDGSLFYQKGAMPVICGPGRLEVAHTRKEHVSIAEVQRAARLYAAMIYEACVR